MSKPGGNDPGQSLDYVCETAELFLATREALESGQEVVLEGKVCALAS